MRNGASGFALGYDYETIAQVNSVEEMENGIKISVSYEYADGCYTDDDIIVQEENIKEFLDFFNLNSIEEFEIKELKIHVTNFFSDNIDFIIYNDEEFFV